MARKATKKPSKPTKQSFAQYLRANPRERAAFIILVGLAVVLLAGWAVIAYNHHRHQLAINNERIRYSKADEDISDLALNIMQQFGNPDDHEKQQSCYYTSNPNEFERGKLVCDTDINIVYSVGSKEDAANLLKRIQFFVAQNHTFKFQGSSTALANTQPPTDLQTSSYKDLSSDLECSVGYTYYYADNPPSGYPKLLLEAGQGMIVELDCNGYPLAAYYPMKT